MNERSQSVTFRLTSTLHLKAEMTYRGRLPEQFHELHVTFQTFWGEPPFRPRLACPRNGGGTLPDYKIANTQRTIIITSSLYRVSSLICSESYEQVTDLFIDVTNLKTNQNVDVMSSTLKKGKDCARLLNSFNTYYTPHHVLLIFVLAKIRSPFRFNFTDEWHGSWRLRRI